MAANVESKSTIVWFPGCGEVPSAARLTPVATATGEHRNLNVTVSTRIESRDRRSRNGELTSKFMRSGTKISKFKPLPVVYVS